MAVRANDNTKTQRVMETLAKYDLDSSAVWDCHGTPVIFHWACERIAEKAGIEFEPPTLIDQDTAKKQITILVKGHNGDRSEWSFGEVTAGNCKNGYPWAMAEKRAKDRVILKLAGLSGDVYSEEESDDFKPGKPEAPKPLPRASVQTEDRLDWSDLIEVPPGTVSRNAAQSREAYRALREAMNFAQAPDELTAWAEANAGEIYALSPEARHHLREAYDTRIETIIEERSAA